MSDRFLAALSTVIAVVLLAPLPAAAQAPTTAADAGMLLRTPDGQSDLQGVWDYRTITPLERPSDLAGREFLTDEEVAQLEQRAFERNTDEARPEDARRDVSGAYNDFWWDRGQKVVPTMRTSLIVAPPDGRIPYRPEARPRARGGRGGGGRGGGGRTRNSDGPENRGLWERCITRNLPRLSGAYNNNFQLFQTPGHVVIINEMVHDIRIIPLDERPHVGPAIRQWLGDSRGHWEGDTLVVDTTNFTDKTNFRGSRENLHLVERFTRVDADTLLYAVTIDDPAVFASPWTLELPVRKNAGLMYEYACHEGNYGMVNLLTGARVQERAAADTETQGSR